MTAGDGQTGFKDTSLSGALLDAVGLFMGTALPVGAANKVAQYGKFLLVDSLTAPTTRTWYTQTSATLSSPNFVKIPEVKVGAETSVTNTDTGTDTAFTANRIHGGEIFQIGSGGDNKLYFITAIEIKSGGTVAGDAYLALAILSKSTLESARIVGVTEDFTPSTNTTYKKALPQPIIVAGGTYVQGFVCYDGATNWKSNASYASTPLFKAFTFSADIPSVVRGWSNATVIVDSIKIYYKEYNYQNE